MSVRGWGEEGGWMGGEVFEDLTVWDGCSVFEMGG